MEDKNLRNRMKWTMTIVASLLLIFSTVYRAINGMGADVALCTLFISIAGMIWGANIADYFKNK